MNAFGSQTGGCAFRLLGLALLMFGGLCGYITFDMPMNEYTPIFLVVAFLLVAGGVTFLWDARRTKAAADERRKENPPVDVDALERKAHKILDKMPNYDGDPDGLRKSGWTSFPESVIYVYERTLKQTWGNVPICISIGFAADGTQYGPEYHLEAYYPQPGDY